jgi:glycosyltransferase EpsE
MTAPHVSAIITVYNGEAFIARAVESLLTQTLSDIEVLVLNDGSSDGTAQALDALSDPRLRVIHLPRTGRAASLALACQEARGRYIANLDADDISYPDRLALQAAFLDRHPDVAWVGCAEEQEDDRRGEFHARRYALTDKDIRRQAAKCIPYSHSGVMFRKSLIEAGINYDPVQPFLIDFEFFLRIAEHHQVANLPEVLVKRYVRGTSFFQSQFKTSRQNRRLAWLCLRAVRRLRLAPTAYVYPLARLVYPSLPSTFKKLLRHAGGVRESSLASKAPNGIGSRS